jgi:hypothetical protein
MVLSPPAAALAALAVAVMATLGGCETTAPRCAFTPCGGALEGRWTVKERCPAPAGDPATAAPRRPAPVEGCPGARMDLGDAAVEGTFTFAAGMTYVASVRQRGNVVATVPLACYPAASGCAAVEAELRAATRDSAARITSVSCSGQSVCTCRESLRPDAVTETGSYRVADSRVIMTSGGDATTNEYCVSGNQLKLRATDPVSGAAEVLILVR